jgi:hypothetical protein
MDYSKEFDFFFLYSLNFRSYYWWYSENCLNLVYSLLHGEYTLEQQRENEKTIEIVLVRDDRGLESEERKREGYILHMFKS